MQHLTPSAARDDFPILRRQINGFPLAFLDNASTTQKPQPVIDALTRFWTEHNANIHRGVYVLSEESSELYEQARRRVAQFLNAADEREIVFTRGTTESINLVAQAWLWPQLGPGDRVLLSEMEHHSNQVPWQLVTQAAGAALDYVPITREGLLDLDALEQALARRPKLLAITAISNVLGTINPLSEVIAKAHALGVSVLIDAAQAVGRLTLDVTALGCDFLAFSAHKLYGPTGIGVLYGTRKHLEQMKPWQGGGGMIAKVQRDQSSWAAIPARFEAGTPPIAEATGLHAAIDYVERWGVRAIQQHEHALTQQALALLQDEADVTVYGPRDAAQRSGLVSFALAGVHPHDVAQILDESGIAVRAGHHCTQVLHERLGVQATVRMSFGIYNTAAEVERTVAALHKVREVFA